MRGPVGLWAPVVACMALIFAVSALSFPPGGRLLPDWASHAGIYALLGALLARALAGGVRRAALPTLVLAAALATVYGVTDEWHQMYVPHRMSEVRDVVNDMIGGTLGAAAFAVLTLLLPAETRR